MKKLNYIVSQNLHTKKLKFYKLKINEEFASAEDFCKKVCEVLGCEHNTNRIIPSQGSFFTFDKEVHIPTYMLVSNGDVQGKEKEGVISHAIVNGKIEKDFIASMTNFSSASMKSFCYRMQYCFQNRIFSVKNMREMYQFYEGKVVDAGNFHKTMKIIGAVENGVVYTPRKTKAFSFPQDAS